MDPTTPDRFFPPFLGESARRDRDTSAKKAFSRPRFEKCGLSDCFGIQKGCDSMCTDFACIMRADGGQGHTKQAL